MTNTSAAETAKDESESESEALRIETDVDYPWAVVIVDGLLRINPGVPSFCTRAEAEQYVKDLRTKDPEWPAEGTVEYEWRPDLEENPNSAKARELLDEADTITEEHHQEAVELLLAAQVYATLAVRDQIAGFGCGFGGLPVRLPEQRA